MKTVTIEQAQGHLQELADLAEQGEEDVGPQRRVFGQYRGKIQIADDFDDPLPDEFWLSGAP